MKRFCVVFAFWTTVIVLGACNRVPESLPPDEFVKWVSSLDRDFIKSKQVRNLKMTARFLPGEYLAYREFMSADSASYDSIVKSYQCGMSFQLLLQAEKSDKVYGNLQYYDVANQEQLTARVRELSFGIENYISLEHNGQVILPVLSHFEGFDPIGNKLSFQVVFMIPEFACGKGSEKFKDVTLVYDDPFFDIGKNNFEFTSTSLTEIPALQWK